jgi:hypothetical protein
MGPVFDIRLDRKRQDMKTLFAFFAGIILTAAVAAGVMIFTPSAQAEESPVSDNETTTQNIIDVLGQARNKITDEDTLAYYDKLVTGYQLTDSQGNPVAVPDIEKIQYTALTLPLEEAGKQIRDPEIKDFYYKFMANSGFDIH